MKLGNDGAVLCGRTGGDGESRPTGCTQAFSCFLLIYDSRLSAFDVELAALVRTFVDAWLVDGYNGPSEPGSIRALGTSASGRTEGLHMTANDTQAITLANQQFAMALYQEVAARENGN